ncbi:hypothetical protein CPB84DRAFT_1794272, partial [Gymnopilus junonius]
MRLINAKTMMVEDFWNKVPVYAILSHTWGDEEALLDGFTYVWVDTCCIDKTSSSELSEAINSMYKWYQEAEVCYAYLVDVSASENAFDVDSQFRRCKWFTRGWTLQELIAPLSLVFYDKKWMEIGTKSSLRKVITQVTNISKQVLLVNHSGEISIAARMLWAANRQTTRIEDMAYCLLGLFGINMPILYGEGQNAFTRLQREIIATSDDHTIFAWTGGHGGAGGAGLLAKSPADFTGASHLAHQKVDNNRSPYNITNVGLSIELPLQPVDGHANLFRALLNCTPMYGIYLNKDEEGQYTFTIKNPQNYKRERIYIKEPVPSRFDVMQWMRPRTNYQFLIKTLPDARIDGFAATQFYPESDTNWSRVPSSPGVLHRLTLAGSGISGGILFESQSGLYERFVVMIGMHNYNVWCDIVTNISPRLTIHDKYGALKSNYQYLVDITITTSKPPNVSAGGFDDLDLTMPQAAYLVESANWQRRQDQSLALAFKNSGTSGHLLLGMHNYKPWSDVVLDIKNQAGAAREIRDSYYNGSRGHRLWDWDVDVKVKLTRELYVEGSFVMNI